MNSNLTKAERFRRVINSDAEARCNKIKKDVDEYIENELKKARRLARQNVRHIRQRQKSKLLPKATVTEILFLTAFQKSNRLSETAQLSFSVPMTNVLKVKLRLSAVKFGMTKI